MVCKEFCENYFTSSYLTETHLASIPDLSLSYLLILLISVLEESKGSKIKQNVFHRSNTFLSSKSGVNRINPSLNYLHNFNGMASSSALNCNSSWILQVLTHEGLNTITVQSLKVQDNGVYSD